MPTINGLYTSPYFQWLDAQNKTTRNFRGKIELSIIAASTAPIMAMYGCFYHLDQVVFKLGSHISHVPSRWLGSREALQEQSEINDQIIKVMAIAIEWLIIPFLCMINKIERAVELHQYLENLCQKKGVSILIKEKDKLEKLAELPATVELPLAFISSESKDPSAFGESSVSELEDSVVVESQGRLSEPEASVAVSESVSELEDSVVVESQGRLSEPEASVAVSESVSELEDSVVVESQGHLSEPEASVAVSENVSDLDELAGGREGYVLKSESVTFREIESSISQEIVSEKFLPDEKEQDLHFDDPSSMVTHSAQIDVSSSSSFPSEVDSKATFISTQELQNICNHLLNRINIIDKEKAHIQRGMSAKFAELSDPFFDRYSKANAIEYSIQQHKRLMNELKLGYARVSQGSSVILDGSHVVDKELTEISANSDLKLNRAICLQNLRWVSLTGFKELFQSNHLKNLHTLFFSYCTSFTDGVAEALISSSLLKNLRSLGICNCEKFSNKGLKIILDASDFENITHLTLDISKIKKEIPFDKEQAIRDIVDSTKTKNLALINLIGFQPVTREVLMQLFNSPHFQLQELFVDDLRFSP